MDYKTNNLLQGVDIEDAIFPEIEGLLFGTFGQDKIVFDYTAYIEFNKLSAVDYKAFMRNAKRSIETLVKHYRLSTSELFYQNTNGHILIEAKLVFVFLAYINPDMLIYFNEIVADTISEGVACSHSYLYSLASEKLPTQELQRIIHERSNSHNENESGQ